MNIFFPSLQKGALVTFFFEKRWGVFIGAGALNVAIMVNVFFYFSTKACVVDTHLNHLK